MKQIHYRVGYLAFCFALLFTGFNVIESFLTTLFPGYFGYTSFYVIYVAFAVSSIFAPLTNTWLASKFASAENISMILSSIGYLFFLLTICLRINPWLVLFGSACVGWAAGTLWNSQGMYITKMVRAHSRASDDSDLTGQATGTFFMIYNINGIAGNLIAIIYLYTGGTIEVMCWIMFLVACSGSFMMCFASRLPGPVLAEDSISAKGADEINETSALRKAKMTMELDEDEDGIDILEQQPPTSPIKWTTRSFLNNFLLKRETLLLTPYFIYQGINTSFCFGNFPTYVTLVTDRGTSNPTILAANIAFIFLGYGCGSIIGSYVWGKLYDLFRSRLYPLLVSHGLLIVVTYSIIIAVVTLPVGYPIGVFPLLLLSSFLLGSIDFLANAVANNSCTKMFSSDIVSVAFAWYRVCFCVGVSVPAIISSSLPEIKYFDDLSATEFQRYAWLLIVVLNIFMAFFSILCGLRLDRLMK